MGNKRRFRYYENKIQREKRSCVRCGYKEFKCGLVVHHKDHNHAHDGLGNLIVLCSNCHIALHQGIWKLEDIGIKTPEIIKPDKSNWHRPKIEINWKRFDELKVLEVPMRRIAEQLGVSHSKLYDALKGRENKIGGI